LLGNARWALHESGRARLGLDSWLGQGLRAFRSRAAGCAGAAAIRCKDTSRFPWRRAQRRQWDTIVLHQRREARRLLFIPGTRRSDRRAFTGDSSAVEPHPISIVRAPLEERPAMESKTDEIVEQRVV